MANWVKLSESSGRTEANILMTVSENESAKSGRTSIFYFESGDVTYNYSKAVNVSQYAASPQIELSNTELTFNGSAGVDYISILSSNCVFDFETSDSWLKAIEYDDLIEISVEANASASARSAYVYVYSNNIRIASIKVTQAASIISANETSINVSNNACQYYVEIDSDIDWTCSATSWISVTPQSGTAGKTTVQLDISENTTTSNRSGSVSFYSTATAKKLTIYVYQEGIYLKADSKLSFTSKRASDKFNITSNTSWEITEMPNWVTLSKTSGSGDDAIIVTVDENTSTSSRSGNIVITKPGMSLKATVKVEQAGLYFAPSATILQFTDKASTQSFSISSDANWSATLSDNWFTASELSGYGDTTIDVTVEENTTSQERTGTIEFIAGDKTSNVNVHQLAKYFIINNETFNFTSKGGTNIITLSTNDAWTAEVEHDADWISLSSYSGEGDAEIVMTVDDNPSINQRSTAVTINTINDQSVRILVSQKPRYLTVSSQSILFFGKGGTSQTIAISTDAKYALSASDSWFTINRISDNTFAVYATQNSSVNVRQGSVRISMTDLVDCSYILEIPVTQYGDGYSFSGTDYSNDSDWDTISSNGISLTIVGYTSDSNWDTNNSNNLSISVTGYSNDQDWNKDEIADSQISITGYGTDKDWNSTNSGSFSGNGYGGDSDWNDFNTGTGSGSFNGSGYGSDSDLDNSGSTGSFSGSGYGSDNDWNNSDSGSFSGSGYGSDNDWNNSDSGSFSGSGYGSDNDWNNSDSGSFSGSGYGSDNDWNNSDSGSFSGSGYGSDSDLDNSGSIGNVSGGGYGSDNDWNNSDSGSFSGSGYGSDSDLGNSGSTGNVSGSGYGSDNDLDNSNSTGNVSGSGYDNDQNWTRTAKKTRKQNKIKNLNKSAK
jgi:hypothetical protein